MADDNNQDMSMEDILSSIKNILEEDQSTQQAAAMPAEDSSDDGDILELSADMRLRDDTPEKEPLDLDAELDDVKLPELSEEPAIATPAEEPEAEAAEETEPRGVSVGWEDFESDPFYEEPAEQPTEESVPVAEAEEIAEEISEPQVETVVEPEPEPVIEETPAEPEPEPVIMPEPASEPEPVVEETPVVEPEPEPVIEIEPEPEPEPEVNAEPVIEAEADSAIDVSANIINNFAKMFSREEPATPAKPEDNAAPEVETVKIIGDGAKTIEDVVASVIRQIIGSEVAAHWQEGVDYNTLAQEEIHSQTKQWLDNNLPTIVEKIVKQEIERVMAKVGDKQ